MRKFLIINRLGIGDVVLTTPLAQIIKENIPECKIGFLVANKSVDILKNHPYIDEVFSYKNKHEKKLIIEQLKIKRYNEAIIVDGRLSSTILAWKSNCKLLNKGFCISVNKKHIFERKNLAVKAIEDFATYAKTLLYINYDKNQLTPKIGQCDKGKEKIIADWIEKIKKQTKNVVIIVPRTAADIKNWNVSELGKLNLYLNTKNIKPIYIGSPNDIDYINRITGDKINIAGKFTLRDIPEIGKYASFALSMCTGPLHILGTVKKLPIIALYGPSDPIRWAPSNAIIVQSELPCVPCLNWAKCDKPIGQRCMDNIKFEQVQQIIEKYQLLN